MRSDLDLLDPLRLLRDYDPFARPVWYDNKLVAADASPVTEPEIRKLVLNGDVLPPLKSSDSAKAWRDYETRLGHMKRIAWLMVHGWGDSHICLDFGVPALGCWVEWPFEDGNHRYVAAILRGDRGIWASCGGQTNIISQYRVRKRA